MLFKSFDKLNCHVSQLVALEFVYEIVCYRDAIFAAETKEHKPK